MNNNFKLNNPLGLVFGGFWGAVGGWFIGIIAGAITGWASGVVVGVNTYGTALVGAAGGAIIGMISGLIIGVLVGNVSSSQENKFYGRKLSKIFLMGFPVTILFLFLMTIITIPLHDFFLNKYIVPFILPPLSVPEKQDLLPLTKYETLPTFGNSPDSSFYKAASSSLFTEVNVFTGIHTGSRGKENPLALVNNAVFIAGFLETDEDDWDTLSLNQC